MTLIELLTTMAILGVVLSGMMAMFIGGFRSEVDMNQRFQAQQNARLALTNMRTEVRSACSETVTASGASVTLVQPDVNNGCSGTTTQVTWCADSSSGVAPFGLYRQSGASCAASTGVKRADSLKCAGITASCPTPVFTAVVTSGQRPQLQVWLPVEANLSNNHGLYTLTDTITLRNAGIS